MSHANGDDVTPTAEQLPPSSHSFILGLGMGFQTARLLLSAVDLDLFTVLEEHGPLTGGEIRERCGLHERALYDFLDALYALRVILREGPVGPEARYSNTPESKAFLVRGAPSSMDGIMRMASTRLYTFWGGLTCALRTGRLQNEASAATSTSATDTAAAAAAADDDEDGDDDTHGNMFHTLFKDEERMRSFLHGIAVTNRRAHKAFAERFDFGGYRTLLDVGGGLGTLVLSVAEKHAHMHCATFDLPVVREAAAEHVAANCSSPEVADRIEVLAGDFFKDESLRHADVITMGNILHDHGLDDKKMLMRKAYDALPTGGALVAIELLIDDDRQHSVEALLMSLNMLIETSAGFDFTSRDFSRWATDIGFTSTSVIPLAYPLFAAIAYK